MRIRLMDYPIVQLMLLAWCAVILLACAAPATPAPAPVPAVITVAVTVMVTPTPPQVSLQATVPVVLILSPTPTAPKVTVPVVVTPLVPTPPKITVAPTMSPPKITVRPTYVPSMTPPRVTVWPTAVPGTRPVALAEAAQTAPVVAVRPTFSVATPTSPKPLVMVTIKPPPPLASAMVLASEDCLPYNPKNLKIVNEGASGWLLTDGSSRMLMLDNQSDAQKALALAQRHTAHCFIGRDNKRTNRIDYIVEYWSGNSGVKTQIATEDCIGYNRANLKIVDLGATGWQLTDGASAMLIVDSQKDAQRALALATRYSQQCFIGRDNKRSNRKDYIVEYWK
jgi:hypothetical protein